MNDMKKKNLSIMLLIPGIVAAGLLLSLLLQKQNLEPEVLPAFSRACFFSEIGMMKNPYTTLSVPTQITKIGDDYFLVDCYHNQILTTASLDTPLSLWRVMTDQINRGHTIAGDGVVYLTDDTENNRVLVFQKHGQEFRLTQTFENIGIRPHYIVYDQTNARFLVLSSMTGQLYVFSRSDGSDTVIQEEILTLSELDNVYVRSFTLDGDDIYLLACNGTIFRASKEDLSVLECFSVPDYYAGMVQLTRIQDYFYLTVSTDIFGNADYATIVRTKDLSDLNNAEDLSAYFAPDATPYYITYFDDSYFLTQHHAFTDRVYRFNIIHNQLKDIQTLYP